MSLLKNLQNLAMEKEAASPDVTIAGIPYAQRKKEYVRHIKHTARRKKPTYSSGMAVGGILGGALGAIAGVPNASVAGGVVGGIGGAFLGALAVGSDRAAISEAKRIQRHGNYDKALVSEIRRQTSNKNLQKSLNQANRDLTASARHRSIQQRLDRMEKRQTRSNSYRPNRTIIISRY